MSKIKHATVSAWQRDHDGTYTAEINGCKLAVFWRPEDEHGERGFVWELEGDDGRRLSAQETHEEIEIAMAEAENAAEMVGDPVEDAA
jgi:hypothetical protein